METRAFHPPSSGSRLRATAPGGPDRKAGDGLEAGSSHKAAVVVNPHFVLVRVGGEDHEPTSPESVILARCSQVTPLLHCCPAPRYSQTKHGFDDCGGYSLLSASRSSSPEEDETRFRLLSVCRDVYPTPVSSQVSNIYISPLSHFFCSSSVVTENTPRFSESRIGASHDLTALSWKHTATVTSLVRTTLLYLSFN